MAEELQLNYDQPHLQVLEMGETEEDDGQMGEEGIQ
jgi:hypothetical protein